MTHTALFPRPWSQQPSAAPVRPALAMSPSKDCDHSRIYITPSPAAPHAGKSGYKALRPEQLIAATTSTGRAPRLVTNEEFQRAVDRVPPDGDLIPHVSTFPAPLVLPDDELFHEPKPMLQSFRAWKHLKERNEVTPERRTIYVVPPPSTADCPDSARWISPIAAVHSQGAPMPNADDIIQYLRAFYTGLHVRKLDAQLRFAPWVDQPPHKRARRNKAPEPPARIAIECPGLGESIGVLHRQDPTNTFVRQLSLNDVLDVALELLPDDAYAVLMLVEHDLYEDEDDDFCIGRAFGGSRIAVVSCARYACDLVGRSPHDWPLSHCAAYVEDMCKAYTGEKGEKVKTKGCKANDNVDNGGPVPVDDLTPIGAAVLAASHAAAIDAQQQQLDNDTWLLRTCRTASHEVAHCLGLDHCEYYACIMQSTSSVSEDVRQPPYLCPVCSKKVLTATEAEEKEWTKAMEQVCTGRVGLGWKGLQAWCEWRLRELG